MTTAIPPQTRTIYPLTLSWRAPTAGLSQPLSGDAATTASRSVMLAASTTGRSTFLVPSLLGAHRRSSPPLTPTLSNPSHPAPSNLRLRHRVKTVGHLPLPQCRLPLLPPPSIRRRISRPKRLEPPRSTRAALARETVVATALEARPLAMDVPLITMLSKQARWSQPTGRLRCRRRIQLQLALNRVVRRHRAPSRLRLSAPRLRAAVTIGRGCEARSGHSVVRTVGPARPRCGGETMLGTISAMLVGSISSFTALIVQTQ